VTVNLVLNVLAGKRTKAKRRAGGWFDRGLLRWHWFGDINEGHYNPHLNILVDGGYLAPERLDELKSQLRDVLHVPDLIVNYSFARAASKKYHLVEYVTRPTFVNYDWDPYLANELYGFRNQRWWGRWDGAGVWALSDLDGQAEKGHEYAAVESLRLGKCPDCGSPLKTLGRKQDPKKRGEPVLWTRPVDSAYLVLWAAHELAGTGYYRIPPDDWELSTDRVFVNIGAAGLERKRGKYANRAT
jgi:hypothetical protein